MLARTHRVRTADDFRATVRSGRRAGSSRLVVHLGAGPARAGFIVPKSVGPAVVRNRVKRQLRHLMRERLGEDAVVVRVLPAAARSTHDQLRSDLDHCLDRAAQ